jgi:LuxR family maltose regulon positive regulatory protein
MPMSMSAPLESSLCSRCKAQLMSSCDAGEIAGAGLASAAKLTRSERAVFELLCRGLPNKQIADHLLISQNTVRYHLKQVYAKLGVRSRARAVARAGSASWPA